MTGSERLASRGGELAGRWPVKKKAKNAGGCGEVWEGAGTVRATSSQPRKAHAGSRARWATRVVNDAAEERSDPARYFCPCKPRYWLPMTMAMFLVEDKCYRDRRWLE